MKIKKIRIDTEIFEKIIICIVIIILTIFLAKIISKIFEKIKNSKKEDSVKKISNTLLFDFFKDIIHFLILIIGFSIGLRYIGVSIKTILVLLASLGFALALALKDFLTQVVAGVVIIFMDYFKIGDVIEIDGEWGIVYNFDLLNTTLKQISNVIVTIPNNKIINGAFTNFYKNDKIKITAKICVSNTKKNIDYKKILDGLKEDLKSIKFVADGKTGARISSFDAQGTIIKANILIKSTDYIPARSHLFLAVRDYFSRNNILLCDYNCIDFLE